jgi:hypothetical protein
VIDDLGYITSHCLATEGMPTGEKCHSTSYMDLLPTSQHVRPRYHARTNSRGGIFSPLGSWQSPPAHKVDAVPFLKHDQHGKQHGWEIDAAFHTFARRPSSLKRRALSTNEITAESPPQNSHSWGVRERTLTPNSDRAILTRSEKFGSATYPPGRPGCQRTPRTGACQPSACG